MILFLDFDGVLHPVEAFRRLSLSQGIRPWVASGAPAQVGPDGLHLFMYCNWLDAALAPFQEVQIVLSTSWVSAFGLDTAVGYLPPSLQRRVIGTTWDERAGWNRREWAWLPRYQQINMYVQRNGLHPGQWLALDDDADAWPFQIMREHGIGNNLLHCHPERGLSDPVVQKNLLGWLERGRP